MNTQLSLVNWKLLGRKVVNSEVWYEHFKLRRAEDDLKEDSVRKAFKRARNWLQDHDNTREYGGKAWFLDEPDRQPI